MTYPPLLKRRARHPAEELEADLVPSQKASVLSAGWACTRQPLLCGRSIAKKWIFRSAPPITASASPKSSRSQTLMLEASGMIEPRAISNESDSCVARIRNDGE